MATASVNSDNLCDLDREFSSLSLRELKVYLRERGENVTGNRPELIKRAAGVKQLGRRTLKETEHCDNVAYNQRQAELFTTSFGEKLPNPSELTGCWDESLDRVPSVRNEDLYNYLVLSKARTFDKENMNAKRQLKAAVFYEDRHVHSVRYNDISLECSHCYVKAKVIPSLPTDNKKNDYDVWVCLAKLSGMVHAAGCNCAAGEGESCNHVAALLYALVDISTKNKDGTNASTSQKCKWNEPRKRKLSPKQSQNVVFKKVKFEQKDSSTDKTSTRRKMSNTDVKPIDRETFCEKLKKCAPNAALLLSSSDFTRPEVNSVPQLHSVTFKYRDNVDIKSRECVQEFCEYKNT